MLGRVWNYVSNNALVSGLLVLLIGSGSVWALVKPAGDWLSADAHVARGSVVVLVLLLLTAAAIIYRLVVTLRRERTRAQAAATPQVARHAYLRPMQPTPETLPKFAPETFQLTPVRCRALIALRDRVDAITTLENLYRFATRGPTWADVSTSKAQIQHDMEDAERAGIVSIERAGGYTQHFRLTTPDGRDWVIREQENLRKLGASDLKRGDPRSP